MKIKVTLLDGTEFETTIAEYDAQKIADLINVPDKFMVAIGDIVVNGRNIRSIVKSSTSEVIV